MENEDFDYGEVSDQSSKSDPIDDVPSSDSYYRPSSDSSDSVIQFSRRKSRKRCHRTSYRSVHRRQPKSPSLMTISSPGSADAIEKSSEEINETTNSCSQTYVRAADDVKSANFLGSSNSSLCQENSINEMENAEETDTANASNNDPLRGFSKPVRNMLQDIVSRLVDEFEPTQLQVQKIQNFRPPTEEISKKLTKKKRGGIKSKASYSAKEDAIFRNNWSDFCGEFGFDEKEDVRLFMLNPFSIEPHKMSRMQRGYFTRRLARNLPGRGRSNVFRRFQNVFYLSNNGPWLPKEEALLRSFANVMPNRYLEVICARLLRRPVILCSRRLRKLQLRRVCSDEFLVWGPNNDDEGRKGYPAWTSDQNVWEEMACHVSIGVSTLKRIFFLKLYPTYEMKLPRRSNDGTRSTSFHRQVIRELWRSGAEDWDEVDWDELGASCHNAGAVAVYATLRSLIRMNIEKERWADFYGSVKELHLKYHVR